MNPRYLDIARMMARVAPVVFAGGSFALKGGTAINLFLRDMPRMSVDLDLVFTNVKLTRAAALKKIGDDLARAAADLEARGFSIQASGRDPERKLLVTRDRVTVKIEVNTVLRGSVLPVTPMRLRPQAREALSAELELPVLDAADVYGGKLVAALDRQHPRDLFDVKALFEAEGLTPAIRRAFVVYLASHNRPPHEVLFGNFKDVSLEYASDFVGMTREEVALAELERTRERLAAELRASLDADERRFLLSIVNNQSDFACLGIPHLAHLPGIQWKLQNIAALQRSNPGKFKAQAEALAARFDSIGS